jgi:uncharacterized protein
MRLSRKIGKSIFRTSYFLTKHAFACFWITLFVGLTCAFFGFRIQSDFSHRAWYHNDHPNLKAYESFEREFGNEDTVLIAVKNKGETITKGTIQLVDYMATSFKGLELVSHTVSLTNFAIPKSHGDSIESSPILSKSKIASGDFDLDQTILDIKKDPLLVNYLVDQRASMLLLHVHVTPSFEREANYKQLVTQIKNTIVQLQQQNPDHEFYVTGTVSGIVELTSAMSSDLMIIIPILVLAVAVLFLFFFGTFRSVGICLLCLAISVLMTLGIAHLMGVKYNPVSGMLPQILIAVCVADLIHLFSAFAEYQKKFTSPFKVTIRTFEKKLVPTFVTSLTTAMGFLGLVTSNLKPIRELGVLGFIGVMAAWVITYFVAPYLMMGITKSCQPRWDLKIREKWLVAWITHLSKWKFQHGFAIVLVLTIFLVSMTRVKVDASSVNLLPFSHSLRQADRFLESQFGASNGIEVLVDSNRAFGVHDPVVQKKVRELQIFIEGIPKIFHTISYIDIMNRAHVVLNNESISSIHLPETEEISAQLQLLMSGSQGGPGQTQKWVSSDEQKLLVKVLWNATGSTEGREIMSQIEEWGIRNSLSVKVTGKFRLLSETNEELVSTFFQSIWIDLVTIAVILMLCTGAFHLGIMAILPNIAPTMLAGALMAWLNINVDFGTVLVAAVCIGISVDDTVHFIYALLRSNEPDINKRLVRVLSSVGPAVVITTLILVVSFSIFMFGKVSLNFNFGLVASVVLLCAMISEFWVLPAILVRSKEVGDKV